MRVGDFSVEVIGVDGGYTHELQSGHVAARPGQVYVLRLKNHGPLRGVVDVTIDGHGVTGGGLVINAFSTVDLERPIHDSERGRFTVIAEGDERVFGPDGGRDNPDLGLIEARFRRELPRPARLEAIDGAPVTRSWPPATAPRRTGAPGWWSRLTSSPGSAETDEVSVFSRQPRVDALMAPHVADGAPAVSPIPPSAPEHAIGDVDSFERAAGTGLTGQSDQEFVPIHVGPLEAEATVIRLRLVIGASADLTSPRPLPQSTAVPARPAPRP